MPKRTPPRPSKKPIPARHEWISLREVADTAGVNINTVYNWRDNGRTGVSGARHYLEVWKTTKGWISTLEELNAFDRNINTSKLL